MNMGISSDQLFPTSLKGIRTKRGVQQIARRLEVAKADSFVTTKGGLTLRKSQIRKFEATQREANKRIRDQHKERLAKAAQIDKKWGREKQPVRTKQEEAPREYTRSVDDFSEVRQLQDFENRMQEAGRRGAFGQDLKDRILKAIRGDVYQQANGFKFKGAKDNILAQFIEQHLSPDEVEHFFGGKLNFEYIYSFQEGLLKEFEIVDEILRDPEYPRLKELWEGGYHEGWQDFMNEQLDMYQLTQGDDAMVDILDIRNKLTTII